MLEKDLENLVANYPEEFFPGEGFRLIGQQIVIEGRRLDILFEDKRKRKVIVEVKRGILTRDSSGQVAEYYGLLKNANQTETYELVLCANVIPKERRTFLETIGIECIEVGVVQLSELAQKHAYRFLDDQSTFSSFTPQDMKGCAPMSLPPGQANVADANTDPSVWVFQGNPSRYDILNSLSDKEIGNRIHWLVRQNRSRIHKGHLVLLWMSGKDAGIYALARVECEPAMLAEGEPEKKYWLEDEDSNVQMRVRLSVIRRFINGPILKSTLLKFPELAQLSILRQFQGTNFPVRDSEWALIAQLM